jgi:ornithine carbamoyltransferase
MDLLTLKDWTSDEILATVEESLVTKAHPERFKTSLSGLSLGMLFQKTSTRTRTSFEVGMTQMGGHAIYMDWQATNFALADLKDEAQVLSRYVDSVIARMKRHDDLLDLASGSEVPVINGCCDRYHPCQALGDLLTIAEVRGGLEGAHVVYTGILNNVANSLIVACTKTGVKITTVTPETNPASEDKDLLEAARETGLFHETLDLKSVVAEADFVYTDTWIDMEFFFEADYQEEKERRIKAFEPYQINEALLESTDAYVMHCLPAHKGYEVTAGVMASPQCIAVDQAENRMHAQKAVLLRLMDRE